LAHIHYLTGGGYAVTVAVQDRELVAQDQELDLLGDAPEWQERALCSQTDPEAFFPEKGGSTREAKRICGRCDVKGECLEYALGHDVTPVGHGAGRPPLPAGTRGLRAGEPHP
jgi:WhiB family redox-sensing transcriptional regulator